MNNLRELQRAADRQWLTVYVAGAALGVWLIASVLVIRFSPNLGIIGIALAAVTLTLLITFGVLFVGELSKGGKATRAVSVAREKQGATAASI